MNIHLEHAAPAPRRKYGRNLLAAVLASSTVLVVELAVSLRTGSLALLADAGHLMVDLSGLVLALIALRLASRPATPQATYGFYRMEVLAAAVNGLLLAGIVAFLVWRAIERLLAPQEIQEPVLVLGAAVLGLVANVLAAWWLRRDAHENINARGAFLNVVGDAVASVGVIISAVLVWTTGQAVWDTLVTFFIAAIISWGAWILLSSTVRILMEAAPAHIDLREIKRDVESLHGVVNVHDLHVWTLTPGHYSASMHATFDEQAGLAYHELTKRIEALLARDFDLEHCTIQLEPRGQDPVSDRYDPVAGELPESGSDE